jgi:hypothetical protein
MRSRPARAAIWLLKALLGLLALVLLLACGYVLFNTPLTPSVRTLSEDELRAYTHYLDTNLSAPQPFVAEKFDHHDVVLIGEMHWKRQDVEFVRSLIPYLYRTRGVRVFAWEFGASDFQGEADAIVNAPAFDRKRAIAFMRRSSFSWNFEEYLDIIRTIWEVNHAIPDGQEKVRFLQLGSDHNPRKLTSADPGVRRREAARFPYDLKMGQIVEREVINKHTKALWYSGLHHAFTHYTQPLFLFLKAHGIRGGTYLFQRYPERVYLVQLSQPFMDRLLIPRVFAPALFGRRLSVVPPFRGAFDQIYRAYGRPFAVDAQTSPFGDLADNHSYYSMDRWGSVTLREMSDGYAMLCAVADMEPVRLIPDWITSDAELEEVKAVLPADDAARIHDVAALLKYIDADTTRSQVKELAKYGTVSFTGR